MVAKNTPTKKLTRRQEKFVRELVSGDGMISNREAAIKAGYPSSSAHTRSWEMLNPNRCPHVVAEIKRYRDELDELYAVDYKRHVRDLKTLRDLAMKNSAFSAAVQAERLRGLAHGDIYVNKSEVRHGTIDQMTTAEVELELKRIRESFEPLIDITPDKVEESDTVPGDEPGSGALEVIENRTEPDAAKDRNHTS